MPRDGCTCGSNDVTATGTARSSPPSSRSATARTRSTSPDGRPISTRDVVLGLFTWDDHGGEHHREIDIELSRWGDPSEANAQFVVQPYQTPTNIHRFDIAGPRAGTTQAFAWTAGQVEFWSLWGHLDPGTMSRALIDHWVNAGPDVPTPSHAHVHVNLWLKDGLAPTDGRAASIVLSGFSFVPAVAREVG